MWPVIFVCIMQSAFAEDSSLTTTIEIPGEKTPCPKITTSHKPGDMIKHAAGYCWFVRQSLEDGMERASCLQVSAFCLNSLGDRQGLWQLTKLSSTFKVEELTDLLLRREALDEKVWFWINAHRKSPDKRKEASDLDEWSKSSKWRWTVDDSSLKSTFANQHIPWKDDQPDNARYFATKNLNETEQCVMAELGPDVDSVMEWSDRTCMKLNAAINHDIWNATRLTICETRLPNETYAHVLNVSLQTTVDKFAWQWILLAFVVLVVLVAVGIVVYMCWRKRRNQGQVGRKQRRGRRGSKSSSSRGSSAASERSP